MTEPRNGSPIFYALLEQMAETHNRKSHDYASNDNPYGNYHFAGMVANLFKHSPEDAGFAGRIAEKLYRLANLEGSGKVARNEGVEDTEIDLPTIMTLWMADRRERRNRTKIEKLDAILNAGPSTPTDWLIPTRSGLKTLSKEQLIELAAEVEHAIYQKS